MKMVTGSRRDIGGKRPWVLFSAKRLRSIPSIKISLLTDRQVSCYFSMTPASKKEILSRNKEATEKIVHRLSVEVIQWLGWPNKH